MAFMGSAQFQKDKFGILLDAVYAKLSTDGTWLQERVTTETETKLGFYTAALSYRVYDDPKGFVDVYGGARYFDTTIEFKIGAEPTSAQRLLQREPGLDRRHHRPARRREPERPLVAARLRRLRRLRRRRRPSWEVYGGANYAFSDRWEGVLGYRYISIQKKVTDRASLDIDIQGPLFGVTYKF